MSIRPMTKPEIVAALRRSARTCIERDTVHWWTLDVTVADGTFRAADALHDQSGDALNPAHAATFLLLCAEALN